MARARPGFHPMARRRASEDACAGRAPCGDRARARPGRLPRSRGPPAARCATRGCPRGGASRRARRDAAKGDPTMPNKTLTTGALALAALLPGAFAVVGSNIDTALAAADDTSRVWIEGHYEFREHRELISARTRREWVPARYAHVTVPGETERVYV